MKKFKKIMAVLVAAMMIMATMVPAFASWTPGTAKITIKRHGSYDTTTSPSTGVGSGNETYTYYQILKADIDTLQAPDQNTGVLSSQGRVAYWIPSSSTALESALSALKVRTYDLFTITPSADGTRKYVRLSDDAVTNSVTGAEIATALNTAAVLNNALATNKDAPTARSGSADVVFEVEEGYYLITSSLGSTLVAQTNGNVTIFEKNIYPSLDKKQHDASSDTFADADVTVSVGDTISYQLIVYLPTTMDKETTVQDVLCTGLTLTNYTSPATAISVGKAAAADATTWTIESAGTYESSTLEGSYAVSAISENVFTLIIDPTKFATTPYLKITYSAKVNNNAPTLNAAGKNNTATLTYSQYSQSDTNKFKTYAAGAVKEDSDTNGGLPGAEFSLERSGDSWAHKETVPVKKVGNYYRPLDGIAIESEDTIISATDPAGEIIIRGLDNQYAYRLVETKAPAGYIPEIEPKVLTLEEDTESNISLTTSAASTVALANEITISNKPGKQLPSTGGMGTTVLYIVGGMLVILAGAYLFFSRKRTA